MTQSSNDLEVIAAKQGSFGTPASSGGSAVVVTGHSLGEDAGTTQSQSIRQSRGIQDVLRTQRVSSGDINFELIYDNMELLIEGVMGNTFQATTPPAITNGNTVTPFTIETRYTYSGGTVYDHFEDMVVNSMNLEIPQQDIITGSFSLQGGKGADTQTSAQLGTPSPVAIETFNSANHVTTININDSGGSSIDVCTQNFSFTIENNAQPKFCIGDLTPQDYMFGFFNVSGSFDVYFEDRTLLELFRKFNESSIDLTLTDNTGNKYTFTFPRIQITLAPHNVGGPNEFVLQNVEFQAMEDTSAGHTLKIEKTDAP